MPYSSYDHDKLETAETMRIERQIYFEAKDGDIAPYVSLPLEQLHAMREESAAAEQAIFNDLSTRAAAWEEQAGKTLLLDKAIEYTRTTVVQHTSNEWQKGEYDRYTRSNRVYQMNYHIYENTRYDMEKQQSVPYSYSLTGQRGFFRQGGYGKVSEWTYQSIRPSVYGNLPAYPAGVRRAFQSKRYAFTGLYH